MFRQKDLRVQVHRRFADHLVPVFTVGVPDRHGDQATLGCLVVGNEVQRIVTAEPIHSYSASKPVING